MTGIPARDLIGFDPSCFYSSQETDFLMQQIEVALRAGHNRYAFVLPRKGGGRPPVIISSRRLENSGSNFGILTFTDISDQVRVEEELRSANATLQARQMEIEEDLQLAARVAKWFFIKSGIDSMGLRFIINTENFLGCSDRIPPLSARFFDFSCNFPNFSNNSPIPKESSSHRRSIRIRLICALRFATGTAGSCQNGVVG